MSIFSKIKQKTEILIFPYKQRRRHCKVSHQAVGPGLVPDVPVWKRRNCEQPSSLLTHHLAKQLNFLNAHATIGI